jgi:hypothetical protein
MTIFKGRPTFLVHLLPFGCLHRHLSFFEYVAVCHLFVCVSGVAVCVLSGREFATRQHTDRKVVNALRTKDGPEDGHGIGTETCRVFIMTPFTEHF